MPDDLLRFIGGPLPFSYWCVAIGLFLIAIVIIWCTGVFVWTLAPARLRTVPVIRNLHGWLVRRRFARSLQRTNQQYLAGGLTPAQAGAAVSRILRSFIYVTTGVRAQYLHVAEIADGDLAGVGPLFRALNDVQFSVAPQSDMATLGRSAEELVRTWR
ncbi:hypothetical protein [Mycolicibacterium brisbanense]|uniref:Uncharacterized protein n=1 Tax=Mycolicibacterium brisbanense TaxID=146020 RepID=A0A100W479_9MYCO|nr:hypothetical protein [Mycolicibacterium brisbanense]MCV7157133.1 hypothetical protein [Mycolicibacterium brisbanense]GAS91306.1 putative uncharacterized protein [Mycolicibacterium brisbanense]